MRWRVLTSIAVGVALLVGTAPPASAAEQSYPVTNNYNGRCLDAAAEGNGANGTRVQLWDCYGPGQLNQRWYFRSVGYYSEFQIVNVASGLCLDAAAQWGGVNGTPIQLWECYGPGQLNQIWYVYQDGYLNYTIRNKLYPRVLDAAWQSIGGNGTPVQLWDDYGRLNQRWRWL